MPKTGKPSAKVPVMSVSAWLERAVCQFEAAGLSYGHGTTCAFDEAAFLILTTLGLPVDGLEMSLRKPLTAEQSDAVRAIIEKRITTRKPAPYLVNEAWIGNKRFYVDERVIVPRSFIGELLRGQLDIVLPDPHSVKRVMDLCTGSGCLAILAALEYPGAHVDATDLSSDALDVARRNVAEYGLEQRVRLIQSDLFENLPPKKYDLILTNPPYVNRDEVVAFPPEHRAEPEMAHAGGADGLDLVRKILAAAGHYLTENGVMIAEIGTGRDLLEWDFPNLPFLWLDTEESSGEVFVLPASALIGQSPPRTSTRKKAKK